ncbi:hypothetical protein CYY_005314 [Polysphondylium violaceum]|uniref:Phosphatidylserine synthase n=1 Tax=Polysphondylium violaceum TaxID=133409 RepID=A0A8J4PV91_9MYCE|nr:hypothetical protein CYY_005314 [Polysphondylium violaceum]
MKRKESVENDNNNQSTTTTTNIKDKKEKDPLNFFYKPHTILALVIAGIITIYFAFTKEQTQRDSVKTGILAACSAFLLFSMLQMRDGLFIRPHPAFWRVIMGCGVLYLCALVFLLFQSADDARIIMKHIDPRLGVPLPERSYADACDLYTPNDPDSYFKNLKNTVQDEFIWAHFFGWWGKTLLLRDSALCWVLSISFEILELTFEHLLPNFKECWWDHIILDILVCNALGIFMGLLTIRYLNMKEYNWGGVEAKTQPKKSIAMRLFTQFTPATFEEYHWEIFSEWKRFLAVIGLVFLISVIELNAFFLKTLLWIPPPNPINIYRLLLWCLIGTPGLREYYQFATDPKTKKLGTMAWICIAGVFVEVLICVKYGGAMFWAIPTPPEVKYPWIIGTSIFTVTSIFYFAFYKKRNPSAKNNQKFKSKVK